MPDLSSGLLRSKSQRAPSALSAGGAAGNVPTLRGRNSPRMQGGAPRGSAFSKTRGTRGGCAHSHLNWKKLDLPPPQKKSAPPPQGWFLTVRELRSPYNQPSEVFEGPRSQGSAPRAFATWGGAWGLQHQPPPLPGSPGIGDLGGGGGWSRYKSLPALFAWRKSL